MTKNKKDYLTVVLLVIILIIIGNLFINSFVIHINEEIQFSHLSYSFMKGKINLLENTDIFPHPHSYNDVVLFNNLYYWPQGPFPAVILMPFVFIFSLFNILFYQAYLQFFLVLITAIIFYKIIKKLKFSTNNSIYFVAAFLIGSVYLGVAMINTSSYYAQIVAVLLLSLALHEYYFKKRYWIIGVIFGLLALTRITASIGI